jgi:hypothetical protein
MIVNLILLMYTSMVAAATYAVDSSARVQCVMGNISSDADYLNVIITVIFLFFAYFQSIFQLYGDTLVKTRLQAYCCKKEGGPQLDEEEFEQWYEEEVNRSKTRPGSNAKREFLWKRAMTLHKDDRIGGKRVVCLLRAISFDYQESFLSEIPSLLLSASYGVTQVVVSRMNPPEISNSENTVDFGQIVPLFLLILPIMAAAEVYYQPQG